jgi:hypothetical protein
MTKVTRVHCDRIWVTTDAGGRIRSLSPDAATLLGLGRPADANLLSFFPQHRRELQFDVDVALVGWPSERVVVLATASKRPATVRYLVSRRIAHAEVELHWQFEVMPDRAGAN